MIKPQIKKITIQTNENKFLEVLKQQQIVKKIKPNMIDYFTQQTQQIKRSNTDFINIKNEINTCIQNLQGTKSIRQYFKGYETILKARTFFLGKLGQITYTFVVALEGKIIEINIDSKTLEDLIFKNKKFGLSGSDNTLRFNSTFKKNLQNYLYDILVNQTGFELITNDKKVKLKFESPSWMKTQLDTIKNMHQRWYTFYLNLQITKKDSISWQYVKPTSGSRNTSSVFSAVGHYAIDEIAAKNDALATQSISKNISPNIGNLTQVYKKAKDALNNGKNSFRPRQNITGESLFKIFQQVRSNIDPFYAGGDELEQQIKSLLGSMPSLTSFNAIKKQLKNLQNALNKDSFQQTKIEIEKMFIKNIDKIQNSVDAQEKQLAKLLKETLDNMQLLS